MLTMCHTDLLRDYVIMASSSNKQFDSEEDDTGEEQVAFPCLLTSHFQNLLGLNWFSGGCLFSGYWTVNVDKSGKYLF